MTSLPTRVLGVLAALGAGALASSPVPFAPRSVALADTDAVAPHRIHLPITCAADCTLASVPAGAAPNTTASPTVAPLPDPTAAPTATLAPGMLPRWRHLRPANDVQQIVADPRTGDVWSVGYDGIAHRPADGSATISYTGADGLPHDYPGTALTISLDGTVYTAGEGPTFEGVVAWRGAEGRWISVEAPLIAQHVAVDRAGAIWIGADSGAAVRSPDGAWAFPPPGAPDAATNMVSDILALPNGDVWLALGQQGAAVHRADGGWTMFGSADGLRVDLGAVKDIALAPDGRVWAVIYGIAFPEPDFTETVVVDVFGADRRWVPAPLDGFEIIDPANIPSAVAWDAQGRPWFAGDSGIYVPDNSRPGRWKADAPPTVELGGITFQVNTTDLTIDADGAAWVATGAGMMRRTKDGAWRRDWLPGPGDARAVAVRGDEVLMDGDLRRPDGSWTWLGEGYPTTAAAPWDVAYAADGIWFATETGAVHRALDGAWTHVQDPVALGGRRVDIVQPAADGSIWFAALGGATISGVTRHRPDGVWEGQDAALGLRARSVHGLATGVDGSVWVGLAAGQQSLVMSRGADGTWAEIALPSQVAAHEITAMTADDAGGLWLYLSGLGLIRRAPDGTWDLFEGQPGYAVTPNGGRPGTRPALAIAPDGSAWLGGRFGELLIRRPEGTWHTVPQVDLSQVRDIAFTPDGKAWMTVLDGGSPRVLEGGW